MKQYLSNLFKKFIDRIDCIITLKLESITVIDFILSLVFIIGVLDFGDTWKSLVCFGIIIVTVGVRLAYRNMRILK